MLGEGLVVVGVVAAAGSCARRDRRRQTDSQDFQLKHEGISHEDGREIIFQVLLGLKVLHDQGRIHKDLKMENVMVDMNSPKGRCCSPGGRAGSPSGPSPGSPTSGRVAPSTSPKGPPSPKGFHMPTSPGIKLIDFDTVIDWEPTSPKAKDVLGTDGYIAPEAYGGQYSPASDIFCVGVIMYKLLTRKFPWRLTIFDDKPGENWVGSPAMLRIQQRFKTEKINFARPPLNQCPDALDLCSKMLSIDPTERPDCDQALDHKWFKLSPDELASRILSLTAIKGASGSASSEAHFQGSLPGSPQ